MSYPQHAEGMHRLETQLSSIIEMRRATIADILRWSSVERVGKTNKQNAEHKETELAELESIIRDELKDAVKDAALALAPQKLIMDPSKGQGHNSPTSPQPNKRSYGAMIQADKHAAMAALMDEDSVFEVSAASETESEDMSEQLPVWVHEEDSEQDTEEEIEEEPMEVAEEVTDDETEEEPIEEPDCEPDNETDEGSDESTDGKTDGESDEESEVEEPIIVGPIPSPPARGRTWKKKPNFDFGLVVPPAIEDRASMNALQSSGWSGFVPLGTPSTTGLPLTPGLTPAMNSTPATAVSSATRLSPGSGFTPAEVSNKRIKRLPPTPSFLSAPGLPLTPNLTPGQALVSTRNVLKAQGPSPTPNFFPTQGPPPPQSFLSAQGVPTPNSTLSQALVPTKPLPPTQAFTMTPRVPDPETFHMAPSHLEPWSTIVTKHGDYFELRCPDCGANAGRSAKNNGDLALFRGCNGMATHMRQMHRVKYGNPTWRDAFRNAAQPVSPQQLAALKEAIRTGDDSKFGIKLVPAPNAARRRPRITKKPTAPAAAP